MKIWGYILAVFGGLSAIGACIGGISPVGGIFFLGLGIFLISRANQRKEREKEMKEWNNK